MKRFPKRLRLLLILTIVLLALLFVGQAVERWHYVLPAPPGQLIYAATFDSFTDEWRLYEGRLSAVVIDNALRLSVGDYQSGPYSEAEPFFADFDVRVEATPISGPLDNAYGLIFRLADRNSYYLFLVSSDGYYRVSRRVGGVERVLSNWIRAPFVRDGLEVTNTLRVVARGSTFHFYINDTLAPLCIPNDANAESTYYLGQCQDGTMQDRLTDSSISSGQIGVIAQRFDEDDSVIVDFDNLLVFGPEEIETP
ncbi:MAG: hypothetical protein HXY40_06290 [Chloroflexi bacterium]|nr:hypothetical protein [Chloroflexota bacterium]